MEAVKQSSPALCATTLRVLSNADPRSRSMVSVLTDLAEQLTTDEAACFPQALGGVLPLLRGDPDRLRFAANIAARLDLYEATRPIAELAVTTGDPELLLAAATLCGNPAVEDPLRARVSNSVGDDPASRIRLDQRTAPNTADEERLYLQCWPGARTGDTRFALAPVIVLDSGLDAKGTLQLALSLKKAGAAVRRLGPDSEVPLWFGSQTILLCRPQTRDRVLRSYPTYSDDRIIAEKLPENQYQLNVLFRRINAALPPSAQLRLTEFPPEISTNIFDPAVFTAGVYQTREVAFLTGAPRSSVYYLRRQEMLAPRPSSGGTRWAFRDLVAVRTWRYLKSIAIKPVSSAVVPALSGFVGDPQAVRLGVMSNGRVHVDRGDGWVDALTGQRQFKMPITDIDDVFRPFDYGGGRVVPLLNASRHTVLHPTVLNGVPRLEGHRISAEALARQYRRGGKDAILWAYPELANSQFDDTVGIGLQLLGAAS